MTFCDGYRCPIREECIRWTKRHLVQGDPWVSWMEAPYDEETADCKEFREDERA